ncbi:type II secretion system F family protein [Paragemmobacter straminiformis]|uniref:Type II secretion system F family protein n=1 Tax=Paragemmobacter straminiformis TaxID=2045119 RepID=A0A842I824_9RHOB|nr:type II secretion system F family protein [Gemmobacter straminiformis]MBC2835776.1 type II secretion system F family protein [Gemmobacter straminiformis]
MVTPLQVAVFCFVSVGIAALVLGWATPSDAARLRERMDRLGKRSDDDASDGLATEDQRRKRRVRESLRELRAREIGRARRRAQPTLTGRLRQAGLDWTRKTYYTVSALVGLAALILALGLTGLAVLPALCFAAAAGLLLPHLFVAHKRSARLKRFSDDFPTAIDIIVRGVRSGMALADGLKTIATEMEEPIRGEFAIVVRDQTLGVPLDEAVQRLADRMPLSETSFFAIVVGIQSKTGGNLSEALSNLSKVLRGRKNIAGKIRAMSSEAITSAAIIGAMPPLVMAVLFFISPGYLNVLFTTLLGNLILGGSILWMGLGILVMRGMIRFDY